MTIDGEDRRVFSWRKFYASITFTYAVHVIWNTYRACKNMQNVLISDERITLLCYTVSAMTFHIPASSRYCAHAQVNNPLSTLCDFFGSCEIMALMFLLEANIHGHNCLRSLKAEYNPCSTTIDDPLSTIVSDTSRLSTIIHGPFTILHDDLRPCTNLHDDLRPCTILHDGLRGPMHDPSRWSTTVMTHSLRPLP